MLARKFLHYQADRPKITGEETEDELAGPPPNSLFLLAACMIKVGGAPANVAMRRFTRCNAQITH